MTFFHFDGTPLTFLTGHNFFTNLFCIIEVPNLFYWILFVWLLNLVFIWHLFQTWMHSICTLVYCVCIKHFWYFSFSFFYTYMTSSFLLFVSLKLNSDGWNTIISNIKWTQTSFFEHRTNSNMFIEHPNFASNERTSNTEINRALTIFAKLLIELTQTSVFWTVNKLKTYSMFKYW